MARESIRYDKTNSPNDYQLSKCRVECIFLLNSHIYVILKSVSMLSINFKNFHSSLNNYKIRYNLHLFEHCCTFSYISSYNRNGQYNDLEEERIVYREGALQIPQTNHTWNSCHKNDDLIKMYIVE